MEPAREGRFRHGFLGANAARYSLAGRNYVRNGFAATSLAPDFTPGDPGDRPRALYLHHPPLVPILLGLSFLCFGETETAATVPFHLVGLAVLLLLFLLARRLVAGVGGAAAAALAGVVPMTGFYGGHVDPQGPLLVLFLLAATLFYLRYREKRRGLDLVLFGGVLALGFLTDWPALYLAGLLPLLDAGASAGRRAWWTALAAFAYFGAYLVWIAALDQSILAALLEPALVRTPYALLDQSASTVVHQARVAIGWAATMFTVPLLLLAALGLFPTIRRGAVRSRFEFKLALRLLVLVGVLHVLMFPQGFLVHDYWTFLLLPPIAILGAVVVEAARRGARGWGEGFSCLVAVAIVGVVLHAGDRATLRRYAAAEAEGNEIHGRFGEFVRERLRPHQRGMSNLDIYNPRRSDLLVKPEFTYYADRAWRGGVLTTTDLDRAEAEEGPFDRYFMVLFGVAEPPVLTVLRERAAGKRILDVLGHPVTEFDLRK